MTNTSLGFSVLQETEDFIIVNKSPGIDMHDDNGVPGLVSRVSRYLNHRVFPVHRLDKVTSGIVLLAKNEQSNKALSTAFSNREVEKLYLAISDKKPKKKQGWIKGDMAKSRNGSWKLTHGLQNPAITYFQSTNLVLPGHRLFFVQPKTGKTHQIRVALKSLGAPILGDTRYGGSQADRVYLHAFRLKFHFSGKEYTAEVWPEWGEKIDETDNYRNFIS